MTLPVKMEIKSVVMHSIHCVCILEIAPTISWGSEYFYINAQMLLRAAEKGEKWP